MATLPFRVGIFSNPQARQYSNDLRTWAPQGSLPLLASTLKPSALGKNYTDRPQPRLSVGYTWLETPQLSVTAATPPGDNYTDRPQLRVTIGNTWIDTQQLGAVASGPLPSYDWQIPPSMVGRSADLSTWIKTPQIVGVVAAPFNQEDWPLPARYPRREQTWIETPQLSVAVTLPPGENFTDRPSRGFPPPVPSWAQFNPNLSQDELPVGENYTDRAQLRPRIDYTWIETPQTSVAVTLPPGENFSDRPQLRLSVGYTWIETPQLAVTVTLPPGENYTDRPRPVTWFNAWTINLQETTLAPTVTLPPGENVFDRPQPPPWYRDWSQNLLENTLAVVYMPCRIVELPNPTPYPLPSQTWIQGPQQPSVTVTLPPGENFTERPAPVSWYREWLLHLQQTTLTPTVILPAGENYTDRPFPVSWYRDWGITLQATTLAPVIFPAGETFTDLPPRGRPPSGPSWAYFNPNLGQDELPVGEVYTDRPQPVNWYREWLLNLQQSTLAPPPAVFPPGQVYADRPAPISWFRDWTVNLGEFTPVGPDILPAGAMFTALPPSPAPQFSRSWESPYNVNLFVPTPAGPIPVRVGAVGRRRRERERPIDPWSRTLTPQHWKELQELIQAEAAAAEEANRQDDLELELAAEATSEVVEALYSADETPAINQDIVRLTASLRAGAAQRAKMEAEALNVYLAGLEDESECELLLFS